jgi:3-oxoacyl-[acyl-carrier protein] reductase
MSQWLKDRVAIVTGSGQGIGKAIAVALAKEGARVITNNRRPGTPRVETLRPSPRTSRLWVGRRCPFSAASLSLLLPRR